MYHNIKVDLIYYNTPADYEFEFNLGGCCRMRLLSDKTTDIKSFLKSLSRAVERSKVILLAGPLFKEDGLLSLVAHAISRELVPMDCAEYGIQGDTTISLIEGATPLVSDNGFFAGCIIESGPQAMILLSENKTVRKSVMSPLIHPYIADLAAQGHEDKPPLFVPDTMQVETIPLPKGPVSEEETEEEIPLEPQLERQEETGEFAAEEQAEEDISEEAVDLEEAEEPQEEEYIMDDTPSLEVTDDSSVFDESQQTAPVTGDTKEEPEPDEEYYIDLADDSTAVYAEQGEEPDFYMDSEDTKKKKRANAIQETVDFVTTDIDSDFHYESPEDALPPRPKFQLPIFILFITLMVILALLVLFAVLLPLRSGVSPIQYFMNIFSQLAGKG